MHSYSLYAALVLVTAAALTRSSPMPQPAAPAANPFPMSATPFLTFTPAKLTIKDTEPTEFKIKLTADPGAVKPHVFIQGDGLRFDKCSVEFSKSNWNKDQAIRAYPKPLFTAGKTKSIMGALLAWEGNAAHGKTQSVTFDRDVTAGRLCDVNGDPHYTTFDGKKFDFMGMKAYYTFKSPNLVVQSRHGPYVHNKAAAVQVGLGIVYGKTVYMVDVLAPLNKRVVLLSPNSDGVELVKNKEVTDLKFRTSDGAEIRISVKAGSTPGGYMNVQIVVPACYKGKTQGLCGLYDDNKGNDLAKPDKSIAKGPNDFGNSWLVPEAECLFTKGKASTLLKTMQAQPKTHECAFPKDLKGFGVAPEPEGYDIQPVATVDEYDVTPLPVVTVSKERKDAAFEKFVRQVCTEALTVSGIVVKPGMPPLAGFINDCVKDCQLGGDLEPVDGYRQAYQQAAFTFANTELAKFKICEKTGKPRPRKPEELAEMEKKLGLDAFKCRPDAKCGGKGECRDFGCACKKGFSKFDCSLDLVAKAKKIPPAPGADDEYAI